MASAAHRKYRASLARGNAWFLHAIWWQELDTDFRRAALALSFTSGLPTVGLLYQITVTLALCIGSCYSLQSSAAHCQFSRQFGEGICRILRVLWRKQWVEAFRYVALRRWDQCTFIPYSGTERVKERDRKHGARRGMYRHGECE